MDLERLKGQIYEDCEVGSADETIGRTLMKIVPKMCETEKPYNIAVSLASASTAVVLAGCDDDDFHAFGEYLIKLGDLTKKHAKIMAEHATGQGLDTPDQDDQ